MTTKTAKLSELTPDPRNANKGTQRGLRALDDSLRNLGAGRSILLDREGRIIAGNKTAERAADIGLDDVIIVETDGRQIVAVQRTDLDLETDPRARQLAYADNRVGQFDLEWDPEIIQIDFEAGLIPDDLFNVNELARILGGAGEPIDYEQEWQGMPEFKQDDLSPKYSVKVNFASAEDIAAFASLVGQTVTENTRSIWYPKAAQNDDGSELYTDDA